MGKQEVSAAIEIVMIRAKYAASTGNLTELRACVEESCDLLRTARTLRSPKLVKQVDAAFWGICGLEEYTTDSMVTFEGVTAEEWEAVA